MAMTAGRAAGGGLGEAAAGGGQVRGVRLVGDGQLAFEVDHRTVGAALGPQHDAADGGAVHGGAGEGGGRAAGGAEPRGGLAGGCGDLAPQHRHYPRCRR